MCFNQCKTRFSLFHCILCGRGKVHQAPVCRIQLSIECEGRWVLEGLEEGEIARHSQSFFCSVLAMIKLANLEVIAGQISQWKYAPIENLVKRLRLTFNHFLTWYFGRLSISTFAHHHHHHHYLHIKIDRMQQTSDARSATVSLILSEVLSMILFHAMRSRMPLDLDYFSQPGRRFQNIRTGNDLQNPGTDSSVVGNLFPESNAFASSEKRFLSQLDYEQIDYFQDGILLICTSQI